MDRNGYIKRISIAEDARLKKIVPADKGLEIQQVVVEALEGVENSLRAIYSEQELEQLLYLLDKLSHILGK